MSPNSCVFLLTLFSLAIYASAQYRSYAISSSRQQNVKGCECLDFDCGCCAHVHVPIIDVSDTFCANITYDPLAVVFNIGVRVNEHVLFHTTISAKDSDPICFGEKWIKPISAEICLHIYDLKIADNKAHGCMKIEVEVFSIDIFTFKLGCFNVGHNNMVNMIRADGQGHHNIEERYSNKISKNEAPHVVININ